MRSRGPVFALSIVLTFFLLTVSSFAIATFSRQYATSCTTCQYARAGDPNYNQAVVGAPQTLRTAGLARTEQKCRTQKGDSR
jgi:hypothetical protein